MSSLYSGIIPIIKQAAVDAVNSTQPVQIVFGTVVSVSPLRVQVTPKLTLGAGNLVVAGSLARKEINFTVEGNTDSIESHTHDFTVTVNSSGSHHHVIDLNTKETDSHRHAIDSRTGNNASSNDGNHTHTITKSMETSGEHAHAVKIPVKLTIDNSLKKGDSVILARMQGGNKYLVLDKAVNA